MNLYFIFEGKTEKIVYEKWLSFLMPKLSAVDNYDEVNSNNYYFIRGDRHYNTFGGNPQCFKMVANAIQDINQVNKYDYLILCIDTDGESINEFQEYVQLKISEELKCNTRQYKELPSNCKLQIIFQNICIETWFLGNSQIVPQNPTCDILQKYMKHFNVKNNNPEELDLHSEITNYTTKSSFHEGYLKKIFKERGLSYKKSNPREVQEEYYLKELIQRIEQNPEHLASFQEFINFCNKIKNLI